VDRRSVLGHDQVDVLLDVGELGHQLGQDPAGHEEHPATLLTEACQRVEHRP
jgi:hypothetical protein